MGLEGGVRVELKQKCSSLYEYISEKSRLEH